VLWSICTFFIFVRSCVHACVVVVVVACACVPLTCNLYATPARAGEGVLGSELDQHDVDSIAVPFEEIPGDIYDIIPARLEAFVDGLRGGSGGPAAPTYNFVRDLSESEFGRACAACGVDPNGEMVRDFWGMLEVDSRGRAMVRDILDYFALSDLDKLVAQFFLKLDVVDQCARGDEIRSHYFYHLDLAAFFSSSLCALLGYCMVIDKALNDVSACLCWIYV
jgi:hypothetical protein